MRFVLYFVLIYIFIPLNSTVDLISMLVFFVVLNEDPKFSIIFAFFSGLVFDLYYPISLGLNILIFLGLSEVLLYLRKYFIKEPLTLLFIFTVYYIFRLLLVYVLSGAGINVTSMFITIMLSLPVFYMLNRICFRVWMKT